MLADKYKVKPGDKICLNDFDTDGTGGFSGGKEKALKETALLLDRLKELQNMLYAEHKHKLLLVLQGIDTAGKDGTIRHVFSGVNPQGVRVVSFKRPTEEELDHDYLWRIHKETPRRGEIVIFNRSHYEDVVAVRVHGLAPRRIWSKRYESINCFEKMLWEEGTTILKFLLCISSGEQEKRLEKRMKDPRHQWKFNPEDLKKKKFLPDYLKAYEDAVNKTSTQWAPWYLIPADRKWYRNILVSDAIVGVLEGLDMKYPDINSRNGKDKWKTGF